VRLASADRQLQAELATINAGLAAAEGSVSKIAGLEAQKTAAVANHAAQVAAIRAGMADMEVKESARSTEQRIKDIEAITKLEEAVNERIARQNVEILETRRSEVEKELKAQERAYEQFSDRVTERVGDIFTDLLEGNVNLLETFRRTFLSTIGQIAAEVLARPIIVPITASLVGGLAGILSPALGAAVLQGAGLEGGATSGLDASSLLTGAGLINQLSNLFGATSPLTNALFLFTDALDTAAVNVASAFGTTLYPSSFVGPVPTSAQLGAGTTVASGVSTLGMVGGAAAIGGGIYGALNANNTASQAAYAASAAAGATYIAGGIMTAAGATAATTGWTGFGLIAAAVLAAIGLILDQVISPAGPSLAVGDFKGLNIGTAGGQLTVMGSVEAEVQKSEGIGKEAAGEVQGALEASLMASTQAMVNAINAIAIDPEALAGSTQEALNRAFADLPTLNSANAEKMEEDIQAQMAFLSARLAAELLLPLSEAFT
jgi:hypothetical protein